MKENEGEEKRGKGEREKERRREEKRSKIRRLMKATFTSPSPLMLNCVTPQLSW